MVSDLYDWAIRWNVPIAAVQDLTRMFGALEPAHDDTDSAGEMAVVKAARGTAGAKGMRLWRNNSGALPDKRGVPVRFGLGNDSKRVNAIFKSSDLIGIDRTIITAADVGKPRGQFVAFEGKPPGWRYSGTAHEIAQLNYMKVVAAYGGRAMFFTDPDAI